MTGQLTLPPELTEAQINERRYRHLVEMITDILGAIQSIERQVALVMASSHEAAEELAHFVDEMEDRLTKIERRAFGFQLSQTASFEQRSRDVKRRTLEQYRLNLEQLRLHEARTGFSVSLLNQIEEVENKISELILELSE